MRHLTLEALARLVDEAPDTEEQRHLDVCESCQEELNALQRQTEALGSLPKLSPAPNAWPELRHRLGEEKLIRPGRPWIGPSVRAAAALALFVAGGAIGYAVRGTAEPVAPATLAQADEPAPSPAAQPAGSALAEPTPVELGREVERTEELFAEALDRFMRASGTRPPDPAARLAALDNIVLTTAEALNESPADPVINSYHLTAVAQRDELLRQLAATTEEPVF